MGREIERIVMDCIKGEAERRAVGMVFNELLDSLSDMRDSYEEEGILKKSCGWLDSIVGRLNDLRDDLMGPPQNASWLETRYRTEIPKTPVAMKPEWVKPENEDYQSIRYVLRPIPPQLMAFMREDRERRNQAMADAANDAAKEMKTDGTPG